MENLGQIKANFKKILVSMAIDDSLPLDMNELDVDGIFDIAEASIKAKEFLCDDEVDVVDQVRAIVKVYYEEDETEMIDFIDEVFPIEKFESAFTAKDFLEQIGLID